MSNLFPKPLTPQEEAFYLAKLEEGDEEAKTILIERNLRLVAHIAKKFVSPVNILDDLISIGTIGLIKGGKPMAQREIASVLNISRSYVSRIEKHALGKLKIAFKDYKE